MRNFIAILATVISTNLYSQSTLIEYNFQTEELFHTEAERLRIQKLSSPDILEYKKNLFNMAIQELFLKKEDFDLLKTTKENFKKVFDFIQAKFEELEN